MRPTVRSVRTLFLLFFFTTFHGPLAAEVSTDGDCVFNISGKLRDGDSDSLAELMEESACTYSEVHLDSDGGSVEEALAIGEQFHRTVTVIDQGAECLSSCALIFMAGRTCSGSPYYCAPTRFMYDDALLGFHAPFLDADLDKPVPLGLAYSMSLDLFRTIQDKFSEFTFDVRQTGYTKDLFPSDLFVKMFSTKPDEFYFVSSNDQFFSFDIRLLQDGPKGIVLTQSHSAHICYNLVYSNMRGWNYSKFGMADYENLDARIYDYVTQFGSQPTQGVDEWSEQVALAPIEYFIRFDFLNMGPPVSGWCKVSPALWDGYYDVVFLGEIGELDPELNLQMVKESWQDLERSSLMYEGSMHYSMAFPLGTPVSDVYASGLIDPDLIE